MGNKMLNIFLVLIGSFSAYPVCSSVYALKKSRLSRLCGSAGQELPETSTTMGTTTIDPPTTTEFSTKITELPTTTEFTTTTVTNHDPDWSPPTTTETTTTEISTTTTEKPTKTEFPTTTEQSTQTDPDWTPPTTMETTTTEFLTSTTEKSDPDWKLPETTSSKQPKAQATSTATTTTTTTSTPMEESKDSINKFQAFLTSTKAFFRNLFD